MAQFKFDFPNEIMADFEKINKNYDEIFGAVVEAGAEAVKSNIITTLPKGILLSKEMIQKLKESKVYKTPSDDGINCKVLFAGYFINEDGRKTPAPLVGNIFEYGRSGNPYPKKPFLRKAFKKPNVREAMIKMQYLKSGGLLEDE